MKQLTDETSGKIDLVKFITAIAIVYYHANVFSPNIQEGSLFSAFVYRMFNSLGNIGNTVFIALSSYLFFYNYTIENAREKRCRRYRNLLVPYVIWNVAGFLLSRDFGKTFGYYVRSFLLSKYDGIFWVVGLLLGMTLISHLNYKIVKKFHLIIISFCCMTFMYANSWFGMLQRFGEDEVWILRDLYYVAVYELAAAVALKYPDIIEKSFMIKEKMLLLLPVVMSYAKAWPSAVSMIWIWLQPLAVWVSIKGRRINKNLSKIFREQSFFILASHIFILSFFKKMIFFLKITEPVSMDVSNLARLGLGTVTCAVCLAAGMILQKHFTVFFNLIMGDRYGSKG